MSRLERACVRASPGRSRTSSNRRPRRSCWRRRGPCPRPRAARYAAPPPPRCITAGTLDRPPHATWIQVARLGFSAFGRRARGLAQALAARGYAAYWWAIVGALAPFLYGLAVALPRRRWRWAALHRCARLFLGLAGIRTRVVGGMPEGAAVLVANHSSYVDSLVMAAVLPKQVAFVAKKELAGQPLVAILLRRLGAVFVERFRPEAGVEDVETLVAATRANAPLLFFPEGTLTRMPGLLAFRLGAFVTAAQAGVPVVPVSVRGTRSVLRGGQWFPRRAAVSVAFGSGDSAGRGRFRGRGPLARRSAGDHPCRLRRARSRRTADQAFLGLRSARRRDVAGRGPASSGRADDLGRAGLRRHQRHSFDAAEKPCQTRFGDGVEICGR